MLIIVIITAAVWLVDTLVYKQTEVLISQYLYFDRALILQGEVWRVITFIFVPGEWNLAYFAISMYFYWLIGNALEDEWGAFRFGVFYLCGALGAIASGFIMGYTTNYYLNLSLFLAFAFLNPNYQVLMFFFFPVKVKYLAMLDGLLILLGFIGGGWIERAALLMAIANLILFFWRDVIRMLSWRRRGWKYKKQREREDREFLFPEEVEEREHKRAEKEEKRRQKEEKRRKDDDYPFEL